MAMARMVSMPPRNSLLITCLSKRARTAVHELLLVRARGARPASLARKIHHLSNSLRLEVVDELIKYKIWDLTLLVYQELKKASWSSQFCQLVSDIVALLAESGRQSEMDAVLKETHGRLGLAEKTEFGCALVESYGQNSLWNDALQQFDALGCSSGPQRFRSLLRAYASMDLPQEAENTWQEMIILGYAPRVDDYKTLLSCYGRCRLFEKMEALIELMLYKELPLDTAVFNMILVSYGMAHKYVEMIGTLQRMLDIGVVPSTKSLNALTKACPSLTTWVNMEAKVMGRKSFLLNEALSFPCSVEESIILQRVLELGLPIHSTVWVGPTWSFDLHGMSEETAYLMLMLWLNKLAVDLKDTSTSIPHQVEMVTGWGKHSDVEGDCPLKAMIAVKLNLMESPFKVDRYNKGKFIARGHAVKEWLLLQPVPPECNLPNSYNGS